MQTLIDKHRSIVEKVHSISAEGIAPYAADIIGVTSDTLLDFIGRSLCDMPVP